MFELVNTYELQEIHAWDDKVMLVFAAIYSFIYLNMLCSFIKMSVLDIMASHDALNSLARAYLHDK